MRLHPISLWFIGCIVLQGWLSPKLVLAQVSPDGTTPTNAGTCGAVCTITGGTARGSNLFHSFQDFNVNEGQQVRFANPAGIANILSRVTGANPSNIRGTLGVDGAANLFLLNPNGIIFGPNAQLDIRGSFLASTADRFIFTDGSEFGAVNPQAPPLLAVNVPVGLQYGTQSAGAIRSQATLAVDPGQSLTLAGGVIQLDGSRLLAPGGRIELGAVEGTGTIALGDGFNLQLPQSLARADIALTNAAEVNVRAENGGDIAIAARNFDLLGSSRVRAGIAEGAGAIGSQGGDITIDATEAVRIGEASAISNAVLDFATGNAGDVFINTPSLTVANDSSINTLAFGTQGNGGNISITTGSLLIENRSFVSADAFPNEAEAFPNPKNAGTVTIRAVDAVTLLNQSEISAFSDRGSGGNILIETGRLFADTSDINSYGIGGDAGDVTIRAADSVTLVDPRNLFVGRARIGAFIREFSGQAGRIVIETDNLTLQNYFVSAASGLDPGFPGARSGEIVIRATGAVDLNNSVLSTVALRDGIGGNIAIASGSLTVQNLASVNASAIGTGSAGNIEITTEQLRVLSGGQILAQTTSDNRGGDITIRASDFVEVIGSAVQTAPEVLDEPTTSLSTIGADGVDTDNAGNAGNVRIDTRRLSILDGAQVGAAAGNGLGGTVTVNASASVEIGGVALLTNGNYFPSSLNILSLGTGPAGDLVINTGRLTLRDGGLVFAATFDAGRGGRVTVTASDAVEIIGFSPQTGVASGFAMSTSGSGDAGILTVDTERLSIRAGGAIQAQTFSSGNGGTVNLSASDLVEVVGTSIDSLARSTINVSNSSGTGTAGSLAIATRRLNVRDGGVISVSTFGAGNAGELTINADEADVVGTSADGQFRSVIAAEVDTNATGDGGNVAIATRRLNIRNGGTISVSTFGQGDAGNIRIDALDRVTLNGGFISSNVRQPGNGQGGNIHITTGDLTLTNGGQLQASTFGQGNAGNIRIHARDTILLDGVNSATGFSSALATATEGIARGRGGDIIIHADSFRLTNGAIASAQTFNAFRGGDITITANTLEATGGGQIVTTTDSRGRAGNITLNIADRITLTGSDPTFTRRLRRFGIRDADNLGAVANQGAASGLFASTTANSSGRGGIIRIATEQLNVQDRAIVAVNSQGRGVAGNLAIAANTIRLDGGRMTAETGQSGGARGAEISLRDLDTIVLQNGSLISANARDNANGGNITIAAPNGFIVATPDNPPGSDIIANADRGNGGNINITTRSLYGIEFRDRLTPDNDITASSRFGLAGTVAINTPDIDPSRGLTELPTNVVDASTQIAQGCGINTSTGDELESFIITGRGGLPSNPNESLESEDVIVGWVSDSGGESRESREEREVEERQSSTPHTPIVEAQGWAIASNGQVMLTTPASETTSDRSWQGLTTCPAS